MELKCFAILDFVFPGAMYGHCLHGVSCNVVRVRIWEDFFLVFNIFS